MPFRLPREVATALVAHFAEQLQIIQENRVGLVMYEVYQFVCMHRRSWKFVGWEDVRCYYAGNCGHILMSYLWLFEESDISAT